VHVAVQLLRAHRPRDVSRPEFRTERFGKQTARPEDALGVKRPFMGRLSTIRRLHLDETLDRSIVGRESEHSPNRGRYEQIALDMPEAPDEHFESSVGETLGHLARILVRLRMPMLMVIAVEYDQSRIARRNTAALLEIRDRARRLTATENHAAFLDTSRQTGIDPTRPTAENLPVASPFYIEEERAIGRAP